MQEYGDEIDREDSSNFNMEQNEEDEGMGQFHEQLKNINNAE
jgi:hypothetical protein